MEPVEFFKDKKVLITGATGFIGGSLTQRILREEGTVRALVRDTKKAEPLQLMGVEIIEGDITNKTDITEAIQDINIVIHCAAVLGDNFHQKSYFRNVNVNGTRILAEQALQQNVSQFIHLSTAWVYGFKAGKDTNEQSPHLISNDPYIDTKIEAEKLLQNMFDTKKLPLIIIQPSQVYGPGDQTWTMNPIKLIKSRLMVLPDGGKGLLQPIYITDLVNGIMAAMTRGTIGETYILPGSEVISVRNFFLRYAELVDRHSIPSIPSKIVLPIAGGIEYIVGIIKRPFLFNKCAVRALMMHATYNSLKAQQELEFMPKITIDKGMKRIAEWLHQSST